MPTVSQKQKRLTISEKLEGIKLSEAGDSNAKIAKYFGVQPQAIDYLIKNKETIKRKIDEGALSSSKKSLKSVQDTELREVDDLLLEWVTLQRRLGKEVNGSMMLAAAHKIQKRADLNSGDVVLVSESWVKRFRERHNIKWSVLHGEGASCADTTTWINETLPALRNRYADKDLYNADETAVFWRALSGKSFVLPEERGKVRGKKQHKDRLTALVCFNAEGDKLPLLLIGTAENPRSFVVRGKKIKLPVTYRASRKAWMTRDLFLSWLKELNESMRSQRRQICIILDNCSCHCDVQLSNIEIAFLPKNTTSQLQAADLGVIRSMKAHFRRRLGNYMLEVDSPSDVSFLSGVIMLAQAWRNVSAETIRNCFRKSFGNVHQPTIEETQENCLDDMSVLAGEEEATMEEPAVDVTIEQLLDAREANRLANSEEEANDDIEPEVNDAESEPMTTSEMIKQLRLVQKSMMTKGIDGWDTLEDAIFNLQSARTLVQTTLPQLWTSE